MSNVPIAESIDEGLGQHYVDRRARGSGKRAKTSEEKKSQKARLKPYKPAGTNSG